MRYDQLSYRFRRWRYRERPQPSIEVRAGRLLPGALVRLTAAVAVAACVVLACLAESLPTAVTACAGALFLLWTLRRPDHMVGLAGLCLAAFLVAISPAAPFNPSTGWIALTGYAGLRLAMVAQLLPWRSRVAPAAIFNWRDALIIGLTAVIGVAAQLPGAGVWPMVLGLVVIMGLAGVVAWQMSHGENSPLPATKT